MCTVKDDLMGSHQSCDPFWSWASLSTIFSELRLQLQEYLSKPFVTALLSSCGQQEKTVSIKFAWIGWFEATWNQGWKRVPWYLAH